MDCLFCKIGEGTIPSETLYEDEDVRAFQDIHPKAPVHWLVIPKVHIHSIAHLKKNDVGVIAKLIWAAKQIAQDRGLEGYKLVFNVGRQGGQVIDHLHLHVLGGWGEGVEKKVEV